MGASLAVIKLNEQGEPEAGLDLPADAVAGALAPLFGDVPDLTVPIAPDDCAELFHDGARLGSQWFLYGGPAGVQRVAVSVWDSDSAGPGGDFRAECTPVLEVLRDLARTTGARVFLDGGDVTDAPLDRALDLLAPGGPARKRRKPDHRAADEAAERYLREYLSSAGPRLAWLRDQADGPLDFSRDSLVPLWSWAVTRFKPRPADAPTDFVVADARNRYSVPRDADLPMWFGRTALQAPAHWDDESLAIIDAIVYYLAECLLRAVPVSRWEVGHGASRSWVNEYQPVLIGFRHAGVSLPIELIGRVLILMSPVYRTFRPDLPDNGERVTPEDLRDCFDTIMSFREA
ncbi:hypothetical protein GCM10010532_078700 [Dactylosporangium siamense]|uniref:Uncharacterized protein n=1 Tax=Dactylosporangium siamense TaxID=685454 RepID=A0A919PRX2_9ACTN|nr:hypothetical protein Dsi01nite_070350 [Dactylosporangium siamense]